MAELFSLMLAAALCRIEWMKPAPIYLLALIAMVAAVSPLSTRPRSSSMTAPQRARNSGPKITLKVAFDATFFSISAGNFLKQP
ncbi:MAG: hypothetical protein ACYDC3_19535 [Candidatus Binataceae bacterium]